MPTTSTATITSPRTNGILGFLLHLNLSTTLPFLHPTTIIAIITLAFNTKNFYPFASFSPFSIFFPLFLASQIGLFQFPADFRNMLGGHNNNSVLPISFGENHFRGEFNAFPQLQLFGDVGCLGGPINHMENDHKTTMERHAKRGRAADSISKQQKHQLSLNNNFHQCEAGQLGSILDPNFVSIGLKLSSEEEERNSSVSHASDRKTTILPVMLSLVDSLKAEMDRQKEEFDHHMRVQEESMIKSITEVGQRHTISFLNALEAGIGKKLHEKELEIQNMNRRNNELVEKIKRIGSEVQSWQYRAKYNESVVDALRSNLKQVMAQGIIHGKEGCGDSEVDDAASYANQNVKNAVEANASSFKRQITCKACRAKESTMLLLPCRHLCLCGDCARFTEACPVCQMIKTARVEVFMS